ncbi:MAG: hypothetical protein AB8H47_29295 [Bacteroidia bacterium]
MPSILMLGRFLPKLHSIRDSILELSTANIYCHKWVDFEPDIIIPLAKDKNAQIVIVDLSSYLQNVNKLLDNLQHNALSQMKIVVIHFYEGSVLNALRSRFPQMHFLSIKEVDTQLLPIILSLSNTVSLSYR